MTKPLWRVMESAFIDGRQPGHNDRFGYASEIEALADWLVPEEIPLRGMRPGGTSGLNPEEHRLKERQFLRARLLEQARIAGEGE